MKTQRPAVIELLEARIAPAFAAAIDLGTLVKFQGVSSGDAAGAAVSIVGDVNGDGLDDFAIGAPGGDPHGADSGVSYLIFGKAAGLASLDLAALTVADGFKIQGEAVGDHSGFSVSGAGDVNGDGYDDLIIGAPANSIATKSAAYVVFGKASGFPLTLDLSTLNGTTGFKLKGQSYEQAGFAVSSAGDINGDGYADLIVGAPTGFGQAVPGTTDGHGYIVFGHAGTFDPSINLVQLSGSAGANLTVYVSGFGNALSAAGDIDGDGLDDLIGGDSYNGQAYVFYGQKGFSATTYHYTLLGGTFVGHTGVAVSAAGDINGDGFDDLLIGADKAYPNGAGSGTSYVVFGKAGGLGASVNLVTMPSDIGFKINGVAAGDNSGSGLSAAGDVNGDGYDDLCIGSPLEDTNGADAGAAYVVFGKAGSFGTAFELSSIDGKNGFKLTGAAVADIAGDAVAGGGDLNGDGFSDLIIGAPKHGPAGAAYVLYGGNGGNDVVIGQTGKTATFTDVDGDLVTITSSKGPLTPGLFKLTGTNALGGATLRLVDLHGHAEFGGAKFTFTAQPQKIGGVLVGDSLVNVGAFDASGLDLGVVKIGGDLGRISAGANDALPALKNLTVNSLGLAGLSTQGGLGASALSIILGTVNKLTVKTNVEGVAIFGTKIGAAKIGGGFSDSTLALFGKGAPTTSADALALGSLTVGGSISHSQILGGYGLFAGNADVQIGKVVVGGDWVQSNLLAGVTVGADAILGNTDDALFASGSAIASRIASVVIKGQALGTFAPGGHFAISAEQIGSIRIGKAKLPLQKSAADHTISLGPTGDFFANEV